jgi:hypothetical protein
MDAQILGTLAAKFCEVVPNNFSMIIAVFLSNTKICISSVH